MKQEIRNINEPLSVDNESRHVVGYAAVWERESNDLGFIETIKRGAITQELCDNCDVFCRFDHDPNRILARSRYGKGSMTLTVDERGLKYEFDAPKTALGDELLEYIKRGDIYQSSFCFSMSGKEGTEKWEKRDGKYYRTILKIDKLWDTAPCWLPAYSDTSVDNRSFTEITENEANLNSKLQEILSLAI